MNDLVVMVETQSQIQLSLSKVCCHLTLHDIWYSPDVNKEVGWLAYQYMFFIQVLVRPNHILSSILLPIFTMFLLLHLKCHPNLTLYPNVRV